MGCVRGIELSGPVVTHPDNQSATELRHLHQLESLEQQHAHELEEAILLAREEGREEFAARLGADLDNTAQDHRIPELDESINNFSAVEGSSAEPAEQPASKVPLSVCLSLTVLSVLSE